MSSDPSLIESPTTLSNYREAMSYLFGLEKIGIKFGLENIRNLLRKLGKPHNKYPSIHIAGTNGKGSTAQFITSILMASGYRVGTYTSPHLVDFSERIQINASPVSQAMITEGISRIHRYLEGSKQSDGEKQHYPTYFEVSTALAFWCFAQSGIDIAVVETGMGGRLDATNVINPLCSVITNIALEHQSYLGNTLEKIAYEKSGIIKYACPLVLGETNQHLIGFFRNRCQEMKAEFYPVNGNVDILEENEDGSRFRIRGEKREYHDLQISLTGRFQVENAALSLRVGEVLNRLGWNISEESMRIGLQCARWPGRMHILRKKPLVVADGAHNPRAAKTLIDNLPRFFNFQRLLLVFGCMRDKDISGLLGELIPAASKVILTKSANDRSEQPEMIRKLIAMNSLNKVIVKRSAKQAVKAALEEAVKEDLVLITGSLYIVGDILPLF